MKVLQLSTYDDVGGAAKATSRLHCGLRQRGLDSTLVVRSAHSGQAGVETLSVGRRLGARLMRQWRLRTVIRRWDARCAGKRPECEGFIHPFSLYPRELEVLFKRMDVIHIHWAQGLMDWPTLLRITPRKPVVLTLHDLHPITGGCVYTNGCSRFLNGCGDCPQLEESGPRDPSHRIYEIKRDLLSAYGRAHLTVVSTSSWMHDLAGKSPVLEGVRIVEIPQGIDMGTYLSTNRAAARRSLGLRDDLKIVLGVANSLGTSRKGWDVFRDAVRKIAEVRTDVLCLTVGEGVWRERFPCPHLHLGYVQDETTMARLFAVADLYLMPSREEAFGQTVVEAMAAGTPVIGPDTWGPASIIKPGKTGVLCRTGDAGDYARAVVELFDDPGRLASMGRESREVARRDFCQELNAERHAKLYVELVGRGAMIGKSSE